MAEETAQAEAEGNTSFYAHDEARAAHIASEAKKAEPGADIEVARLGAWCISWWKGFAQGYRVTITRRPAAKPLAPPPTKARAKVVDVSEANFEPTIEAFLLSPTVGCLERTTKDYDRNLCLDPETVLAFLYATQPQEWEKLEQQPDLSS